MNHALVRADQRFKSRMIAVLALRDPGVFFVGFDHAVQILAIKTNEGGQSFEVF
ncbi:MAG TPA: hypothetical protein VNN22_13140 [Verrucomicrobiae bacterium]|nr:hypothetical protein [Verrucomicrobiae bacterium]